MATTCCEQVYYRAGQKTYFGIGFKNRSGGYEIRSQNFKGCGTCKDITFIPHGLTGNEQPRHLCLFEGFIDFLSYVTLQVNGDRSLLCAEGLHDTIVLNSVVNIKKIVGMINRYAYIHCYLNNDEAGERGYSYLLKLFGEHRVINESTRYLEYNDVNDFICGKRKT